MAGTPAAIFDQWWPGPGRWLGYALTLVIIVALAVVVGLGLY